MLWGHLQKVRKPLKKGEVERESRSIKKYSSASSLSSYSPGAYCICIRKVDGFGLDNEVVKGKDDICGQYLLANFQDDEIYTMMTKVMSYRGALLYQP